MNNVIVKYWKEFGSELDLAETMHSKIMRPRRNKLQMYRLMRAKVLRVEIDVTAPLIEARFDPMNVLRSVTSSLSLSLSSCRIVAVARIMQ